MQYRKHIHVLNLVGQIPCYRNRRTNNVLGDKADALAAWDHLFYYIHQNWAEPLTVSQQVSTDGERSEVLDCKTMLAMTTKELTDRLLTLPPYFTEALFPVAVARYLLRDLAIPLRHRQSTTFDEFHRRYGTMILSY